MTIRDLWNRNFDRFVAGNKPVGRLLFHHFIGCTVNPTFKFMGMNSSIRVHLFTIQPSGTGKSFSVKLTQDIMKKLGSEKTLLVNIMTEASLSGTVISSGGGMFQTKYGLLAKLRSLAFDEGNVLLKGVNSSGMTDSLQTAMDEPGIVSKHLRGGDIRYETDTSIVASSYFTDVLSETVLTKGFLQRMLLSVSETKPDRSEIIKRVSACYDPNFMESMYKELIEISKVKQVEIPSTITGVLSEYSDLLYKNEIENQYDDKRGEILETFFNRSTIYITKLAVQNAIINHRDKLLPEDIYSTQDVMTDHLQSVCRLLDYVRISKRTGHSTKDRLEIILWILQQNNDKCSRTTMINTFRDLRKRKIWNLSYHRTLSFMDNAIGCKIVDEDKVYTIESDFIGTVGGGKERWFYAKEVIL